MLPRSVGALFLVLALVSGAHAPSAPQRVAVRAQRMVDVVKGVMVTHAVVIIENDRITASGADVPIPAGTRVVDLGDATLLPGMIDAHSHLLQSFKSRYSEDDNLLLQVAKMSTAKRALLGSMNARDVLSAGITTVRDLGNSGNGGDVALRDAIDAGWIPGPRIVASTRALSGAGGQFGALTAAGQQLISEEYVVVSGVEEARKATRQAIYDGATCIKLIVDTPPRVLSADEIRAVVAEAHRAGRKVAAHAVMDTAIRSAVEAGVDSIEHGYNASEETLKLMARNKVVLVPTDYRAEHYELMLAQASADEAAKARARMQMQTFAAANRMRLTRAVALKVRIVAGSDAYYDSPDMNRGEASVAIFRAYADAGLAPLEIIRSTTLYAADLLGMEKRVGVLDAGAFADLVAVRGDPLRDSEELTQVKFVMKGGAVVRNDLTQQ